MTKYNDAGRIGITYAVDYTSVSTGPTTAFGAQTYIARLAATSPIHFRVYDASVSSTCTSADPILPVEVGIIGVTPGQKITFIKATGPSSADGRVTVSELS